MEGFSTLKIAIFEGWGFLELLTNSLKVPENSSSPLTKFWDCQLSSCVCSLHWFFSQKTFQTNTLKVVSEPFTVQTKWIHFGKRQRLTTKSPSSHQTTSETDSSEFWAAAIYPYIYVLDYWYPCNNVKKELIHRLQASPNPTSKSIMSWV